MMRLSMLLMLLVALVGCATVAPTATPTPASTVASYSQQLLKINSQTEATIFGIANSRRLATANSPLEESPAWRSGMREAANAWIDQSRRAQDLVPPISMRRAHALAVEAYSNLYMAGFFVNISMDQMDSGDTSGAAHSLSLANQYLVRYSDLIRRAIAS